MTRGIKLACSDGATHHALAALAITQAGLMRGFQHTDGFSHDVVLEDEGLRNRAGTYRIQLIPGKEIVCKTTTEAGCEMLFQFTWPELKLLGYQLEACRCIGKEARHVVPSEFS